MHIFAEQSGISLSNNFCHKNQLLEAVYISTKTSLTGKPFSTENLLLIPVEISLLESILKDYAVNFCG